MAKLHFAASIFVSLASSVLWLPQHAVAADDASPSMLGKWTLRLYVHHGGVGIPLRDATLTISETTIKVELTQIDADGKPAGTIRREFQYERPVKSDPSLIDVSSTDQGTTQAWQGRVRVLPDELVLHLAESKGEKESVRPKELFDFSGAGQGMLLLAATRETKSDSAEKDSKSVRGVWEVKKLVREGAGLPETPDRRKPFLGTWTVLHDLVLLDGLHPLLGTRYVQFFHCEFDLGAKPPRLSIWQPGNGRIQKGEWLSIYKVEGDSLTICSNGMNTDQQGWPTAFESKRNSPNAMLYTFQRLNSRQP